VVTVKRCDSVWSGISFLTFGGDIFTSCTVRFEDLAEEVSTVKGVYFFGGSTLEMEEVATGTSLRNVSNIDQTIS
jgi:hypothetical protein